MSDFAKVIQKATVSEQSLTLRRQGQHLPLEENISFKEKSLEEELDKENTEVDVYAIAYDKGVEEGRKLGYADGFKQGVTDGLQDAEEKLAAEIDAQKQALDRQDASSREDFYKNQQILLDDIEQKVAQAQTQNEDMVLALAFTLCCKVLGKNITQKLVLKSMVDDALEEYAGVGVLEVWLHPDDYQTLNATHVDKESTEHARKVVQYRSDASVKLGGCIIRGENGGLDARIERQIENLKEGLLALRMHGAENKPNPV